MSEAQPTISDRYRLIRPLGQGGMGRVWLARDEILDRDVAVKELVLSGSLTEGERRELRERVLREARAIARLTHANVVRVFDVLVTHGEPWIVMEYVPSRPLSEVLSDAGPMPPQEVARIGLALIGALRAAHEAGLLHRDIKPANVLLDGRGGVVLTDFGLAVAVDDPGLTQSGVVLGSAGYLAPERALGNHLGPESDVWSLGATLYDAVEGCGPYERSSAIATLAALATELPRPPQRAGGLTAALEGMLRRDPQQRIGLDEAERLLRTAAAGESDAVVAPSVGADRQPAWQKLATAAERPAAERRRRLVVVLTVLALLLGGVFGFHLMASGKPADCANPIRLAVAVAPELLTVVQAAASDWTREEHPTVGSRCVAIDAAPAEPAEVAATLAARAKLSLPGLAPGPGQVPVPHVWISDSSSWLQRLRGGGQDVVPATAPSIARSPVVVAMPRPVAASFGWPAAKLTWTDLLRRMSTGSGLRSGLVEPTRDAAGLAGLVSIAAAANGVSGGNGAEAAAAALHGLALGRSAVRDDLLQRFPRAGDPASLAGGLAAAPLSEQSVYAFNARNPVVPLAALYVDPAPAALDYPYAVVPGIDADRVNVAEKLRVVFASARFRDRLATVGLRAADGSRGNGFPDTPGAAAAGELGGKPVEVRVLNEILTTWSAMTTPARTLTVVDVSGSMFSPVPTANNASRMAVTREAAERGLALFGDTWSSGLWVFSTRLDGEKDYLQLVPIGPVSEQRSRISAALASIQPKPNGGTGLHDTLLAGYQELQRGYEPGRPNTLIMLTDGENDDPAGLSQVQLLAELGRIKDPKRPVRVLIIAIGPDVAPSVLKPITDLVGGTVFAAPDPARIGEIFLQAITTRPA